MSVSVINDYRQIGHQVGSQHDLKLSQQQWQRQFEAMFSQSCLCQHTEEKPLAESVSKQPHHQDPRTTALPDVSPSLKFITQQSFPLTLVNYPLCLPTDVELPPAHHQSAQRPGYMAVDSSIESAGVEETSKMESVSDVSRCLRQQFSPYNMTVWLEKKQLNVWIRDTSLSESAVKRITRQLQLLAGQSGMRLKQFVVNGQMIKGD